MMKKRKLESEWLVNLLESKFFDSCSDHQDLRKNEKNVFCIDCNLCFCKHCITSKTHSLHRCLQICKYVYHDVVRLQDIQKHLDCSKIQTYKINGEKAIHLNPRPQQQHKESKLAKPKIGGTYCEACGRHIQDLPNRFCSIACKVSVMTAISKDENQKMVSYFAWKGNDSEGNVNENESSLSSSIDSMEENIQGNGWLNSRVKPKRIVKHKRKGVPQRAPLC